MFDAAEIVQMALRIEENGLAFYQAAAPRATDPATRAIFERLASDEQRHAQLFQTMLTIPELDTPSEESYPGEYEEYLTAFADSHVFNSAETSARQAQAISSASEALRFAMAAEQDSIALYLHLKELVPAHQKPTVEKIITEERMHYINLSKALTALGSSSGT
jgi:rubrerythrin